MLFDIISKYSSEEKQVLCDAWKQIIQHISRDHDAKKIISFLTKAWILNIDDKKQIIHIWVSNEFLLTQVKKFFHKALTNSVQQKYAETYKVKYHIYTALSKKWNDLHIDLQKLFNLSLTKKDNKTYTKDSTSLQLANKFWIKFSPHLNFNSFVNWSHSTLAFSAAKAVANQPWKTYNPLFIYGGVWLGKTHLLQSIGQAILEHTERTVLYIPATKLIDNIIQSIRKNKLTKFIADFTKVDVLLIDDIQFLSGKEKTQEIFLTIFNELVMNNKQIVMSSDQAPRELSNIEPRLKTRFAKWLVADMQAPDYETRIAILQAKLTQKWETIDFDLLSVFAETITDNVRELEWALNIVLTNKKLTHGELTEDSMIRCLKTLWYNMRWEEMATHEDFAQITTSTIMSFSKVVDFVSKYYSISVSDLKSESRTRAISQARQMLMSIAKNHFNWTLEKIWDYFGGKNHTAVIYACRNFEKKLKKDKIISHDYAVVVDRLN